MKTQTATEMSEKYLMQTYRRQGVAFASGQGMRLTDVEGKTYLDFVAGIAVSALGHNHPALVQAISSQAGRVIHVSNLYLIPEQALTARWLVEHSALDRVFFCNSGAEANEAAIKLARKYASRVRGGRFEIVVAEHSFHGRTLAALAATAQPEYQEGFAPLPSGFVPVPLNDIDALRAAVSPATCAVLLEPVQGEGGVQPADPDYLRAVRALCDDAGLLLMLDEIQTGIGRTGRLFAYEHAGIEPDIMTLAKGLGGGFPIGAMLAKDTVARAFEPGNHGSTFGGNPLACAAALAVLTTIEREHLVDNAANVGTYLLQRLHALAGSSPVITAVRGRGLMVAIDLATDAAPVVDACRAQGLLVNAVQAATLRLVPPLITTPADVDEAIEILGTVLAALPQPATA
jgi:acetylornithine/N-succinyldiaminopimelate aminotransferase